MPHTQPPAAPGGNLTPEAQAEHTRRVNACLARFGDMPTELIEQMPCTVDELELQMGEQIQKLVAALRPFVENGVCTGASITAAVLAIGEAEPWLPQ